MRPRYESMDACVETNLLTLTPAFMDALKKVAPKKRTSKVPYVIALAMLAVVAVLGVDRSTREFGVEKGRQMAARLHETPAAPAAAPVDTTVTTTSAVVQAPEAASAFSAPPSVTIESVSAPVVNIAPVKKATKTPAAQTKRPQPRSAVPASAQGRTAMYVVSPLTREL